MSTSLSQFLLSSGLNAKETNLFIALIKYGSQTANTISQKIGIPRSTANFVFSSLIEKGFATKEIRKKTPYYQAVPIESIEYILMEKEAKERTQLEELEGIMPLLNNFKNQNPQMPTIRSFEGVEGVRRTIADTCEKDQPVYIISSHSAIHPKIKEYLENTYVSLAKKHTNKNKIIIVDSENAREYIEKTKGLYDQVVFINAKENPLALTTAIYGDKIAFISYDPRDMTGIIIENKLIADQMREMFRALVDYFEQGIV